MKEFFYFCPKQYGLDPAYVLRVSIIGEFNKWGQDKTSLKEFELIEDKTSRWVGFFELPEGRHFYKFIVNGQTVCPAMGFLTYSTVSTPQWAKKAVWYQIMTDRFYKADSSIKTPNLISWDSPPDYFNNFGGDLKGITQKISYFKELLGSLENIGFYLNPLHKSLASNHKYWPEDFMEIDPQFGNDNDLKELAEVLHKENAKIIIDLVYNHTGLNHYAFQDILKNGQNSKYFEWYKQLAPHPEDKIEIPILEVYTGEKPQNIEIENDPRSKAYNAEEESCISVWDGKYKFIITEPEKYKNASIEEIINGQSHYKLINLKNKPSYKCWAGFFEIPELNTKNPEVKQHLFDAAKKFIKLGIDGFRLDVPDLLEDAHIFWQEFRQKIRKEMSLQGKNPDDLYIVGEIWTLEGISPSYLCAGEDGKPLRYDALMNYPYREAILNFFSGEILNKGSDNICRHGEISVEELDKAIHRNISGASWGTNQVQFNVFSSHDTRRLLSALKYDTRKFKAVLMMQFTLPGAPVIYYGEELAMTGGEDPANRAPMKWDVYENLVKYNSPCHCEEQRDEAIHLPGCDFWIASSAAQLPDKSPIDESSTELRALAPPRNDNNVFEIFNLYKNLINLRKNYDCLINSPLSTLKACNNSKTYAYARYQNNTDCVITVISGLSQAVDLSLSGMPFENIKNWKNLFTGKIYTNSEKNIVLKHEDFSDSFGVILVSEV